MSREAAPGVNRSGRLHAGGREAARVRRGTATMSPTQTVR
jgi:hypothetical protein